ncbi:Clp protease N-terminal domain-containing protein [Streptomyces albus]|uniref:Clp protease N-terminal domain-containing protein n=1 Tax=unclassified Streptomyces TaxID=2593676 RepID=UPI0004C579F6|nr:MULTISPECIES: Clp protease N-terminal domain-containing protein [unclassified Streptomyces]
MTLHPFGSPSGGDPFPELLDRIFGTSHLSSPPAVRRVPVERLLTDSAREMPAAAFARARRDGGDGLDTAHLLWAAARTGSTRALLARAGLDPDTLAGDVPGGLRGARIVGLGLPGPVADSG